MTLATDPYPMPKSFGWYRIRRGNAYWSGSDWTGFSPAAALYMCETDAWKEAKRIPRGARVCHGISGKAWRECRKVPVMLEKVAVRLSGLVSSFTVSGDAAVQRLHPQLELVHVKFIEEGGSK